MRNFDPVIPRGLEPEHFPHPDSYIGLLCQSCNGKKFYLRAAKSERNLRLICSKCKTIQTDFIGLYLGGVVGTA